MAKKSNPTNKSKGLRRLAPLHGSPSPTTKKLKDLLQTLRPLPWHWHEEGESYLVDKTITSVIPGVESICGISRTDAGQYIAHASNTLPLILDDLHSMLADALKYPQLELCDHHKQRLIGMISRIEEVKMENAKS
jgi:hypothetical protein